MQAPQGPQREEPQLSQPHTGVSGARSAGALGSGSASHQQEGLWGSDLTTLGVWGLGKDGLGTQNLNSRWWQRAALEDCALPTCPRAALCEGSSRSEVGLERQPENKRQGGCLPSFLGKGRFLEQIPKSTSSPTRNAERP